MTIDEKIKLLESRIAETDKLLAEIKKEKENEEKKNTESVLAEYWNRINSGRKVFYLDGYNTIIESGFIDVDDEKYNDNNTDHYSNYPIFPNWHNDIYLRQCLYNLEEKAMCRGIPANEWRVIYNRFKDFTQLWEGESSD